MGKFLFKNCNCHFFSLETVELIKFDRSIVILSVHFFLMFVNFVLTNVNVRFEKI